LDDAALNAKQKKATTDGFKGRALGAFPLLSHKERIKWIKKSKTEEKLKQTFCFKLLKSVNKILLQHQWPCNKLRLIVSSGVILNDPVRDRCGQSAQIN